MYKMSFLILLLLITVSLFAGETDSKRKAEHAKVKAHIEKYSPKLSKIPTYQPDLPEKYSGQSFSLNKTSIDRPPRKSYILNGNKITTIVWDYGGIGPGGESPLRGLDNVVWNNLSYVYQFGPLVGGSVLAASGEKIKIISEKLTVNVPQRYAYGQSKYPFSGT